ncbi:MAG: transcriptional regulator [Sphingobacteriales bacterium]|nr:MAG: transcriptional regulator [Sphingobacteriales bacterium]
MGGESISQENLTGNTGIEKGYHCPGHDTLKLLAAKWNPLIFRMVYERPVRFSEMLRKLPGSNRQSLAVALKELEHAGMLHRVTVKLKPLHVEYTLTEKGSAMIEVYRQVYKADKLDKNAS